MKPSLIGITKNEVQKRKDIDWQNIWERRRVDTTAPERKIKDTILE